MIGNVWLSPTIQAEGKKVTELISNVYTYFNKKNCDIFVQFETAISAFEERAIEIETLYDFLKDRINAYDGPIYTASEQKNLQPQELNDMLNAKRESEENAENIGIRIRRFREYQAPVEELRKRYYNAKAELERDFIIITSNFELLEMIDRQLNALYQELCSRANTRLSWYWQGVIKKHPKKTSIQIEVPEVEKEVFDTLYSLNIRALEDKLNAARAERDRVLALSIV
ncbi:MAG: hypothetical protein IJ766_08190 [Clostridia bacterium]|nr:hypothetical protein [Clostridia bacterium]